MQIQKTGWVLLAGFFSLASLSGCGKRPELSPELAPGDPIAQRSAPLGARGKGENETVKKQEEEPAYLSLPMMACITADGKSVRSGWIDRDKDTFYAIKGVVSKKADLKPAQPFGPQAPVPLGDATLVEVEPPIYYLEVGKNEYAPGYYTKGWPTFMRWRDVTLNKEELPEDLPAKRILDKEKLKGITTMTPPKYLLNDPGRWKKVAPKPD